MGLKLYWMPISQPARCVAWALEHAGVEYESVNVMPGKDTRTAEYMEKSGGIGTVPMIEDDGFFLSESHAILTYLAEKHGDWQLYPSDIRGRAKVQQYFNWHHRNVRNITTNMFAPAMRPDLGLAPAPLPTSAMKTVEAWLSKSEWIAGDAPTLADLSAYCDIGQAQSHLCNFIDFGCGSRRLHLSRNTWPLHAIVHSRVLRCLMILFLPATVLHYFLPRAQAVSLYTALDEGLRGPQGLPRITRDAPQSWTEARRDDCRRIETLAACCPALHLASCITLERAGDYSHQCNCHNCQDRGNRAKRDLKLGV